MMQSRASLVWHRVNVPLRSFALSGALLLQMVPAALAGRAANPAEPGVAPGGEVRDGCAWTRAIVALGKTAPDNSVVMTSLWHGPEILWRTQLRVIGAPYEIPPALRDTDTFMNGSEREARDIAVRRHIAFVLVCARDPNKGFAAELARGEAPNWLEPLFFDARRTEFRLYRVVGI